MEELADSSYRRHYARVYRFVRRRSGSAQEAEDVTQEVFAAALAALAEERLHGEPELAWLYTVAERRLIATWRRSIGTEPLDPETTRATNSTDAEVYGRRSLEALLAGLRRLPSGQRQVVVLKLFEGRPFAEIASRLGVNEEACRMRLSRALSSLREHLEAEGVDP